LGGKVRPTDFLKRQAEYPRELIPWYGVGGIFSNVMSKVADMLPEFSWVPELPEVPTPPAPPWSGV